MSDSIGSNKRRGVALVVAFVVLVALIGLLVGLVVGQVAVAVALAIVAAVLYCAAAYRLAGAAALRVGRARPADAVEHARLHNLVEGLCVSSGLPKPALFVVDDAAPNAFAVGCGPNDGSIAMTTGMLASLERVELEGVVAQQLSLIKNRDTLVSSLAVLLVAPIALVADLLIRLRWWNGGRVARPGDQEERSNPLAFVGLALLALSPPAGWLMRIVVPSTRLTLADVTACQLTRYPPGLVEALEKLGDDTAVTHAATTATAHLWIEQPLSGVGDDGKLGSIHRLFDTHPPLEERIALLREL